MHRGLKQSIKNTLISEPADCTISWFGPLRGAGSQFSPSPSLSLSLSRPVSSSLSLSLSFSESLSFFLLSPLSSPQPPLTLRSILPLALFSPLLFSSLCLLLPPHTLFLPRALFFSLSPSHPLYLSISPLSYPLPLLSPFPSPSLLLLLSPFLSPLSPHTPPLFPSLPLLLPLSLSLSIPSLSSSSQKLVCALARTRASVRVCVRTRASVCVRACVRACPSLSRTFVGDTGSVPVLRNR